LPSTSFVLSPRSPFRLDLTVWLIRRRSHNLMDRWDGRTYERVLMVQEEPVLVTVVQTGPPDAPELQVRIRGESPEVAVAGSTLKVALTQMLGLDADLAEFYHLAGQDRRLQALVQPFQGFKPPRFPGVFEALVNAVACQQLSLTVGIHLLNRLAANYGPSFPGPDGPIAAFPRALDLAGADPENLRRLGFSRSKGRTLIDLAQGVAQGRLDLEKLDTLDDDQAVKYLEALRGIGRWSADYVLLRGLGRWQIFPGGDVGARKRLQVSLELPEPLEDQEVSRLLARWQPFGGLIYFHLLLGSLAEEGALGP
jgi:DNA-3-methyladenine glycosylase II